MLTAFKLKVFGDDTFGKVSTHCKVGAGVINLILENNFAFFPCWIRQIVLICPYSCLE
jgi:hypothetical protein